MKFFSIIAVGTILLVGCNGDTSSEKEVDLPFNSEETEVIEDEIENVDEVVMTEEDKINFLNKFKPGPEDEKPYNIYALYDFHVTATDEELYSEGERQLQVNRNLDDAIYEVGWNNFNFNNIPFTGAATGSEEAVVLELMNFLLLWY
ncbi:hypothetical protein [Alkalihalobacterium alkalinitrilicum]|uniref:hypothetical protein n=1 Tax=Alkalihalobacterium alkalinitrilicum TaxID=427920 RepID=UPI000995330A|nr:hypothetical protein [Alkalihalobacterium alkalinitrilicum]